MSQSLSHLNAASDVQMVDVSGKTPSLRSATATGSVVCKAATLELIAADRIAKGNVLATARVAGIMAAKRTAELIPLCHPLPVEHVEIGLELDEVLPGVRISTTVRLAGRTGVEMEALTAVAVAGLTIIDMVKSVDRWATITDVCLLRKEGGKSGALLRPDAAPDEAGNASRVPTQRGDSCTEPPPARSERA